MAALSALRLDLRTRFQDKNGGFLSAVPANLYLNLGCEDFVNDVQPMSREYGWTLTAKKFRYDLPSDFIQTRAMMWYYGGQDVEIPYRSPQEFKRLGLMNKRETASTPEAYTIIDDDIYIGPAPSASSNTSSITAAMLSTDSSMTVADATKFHSQAGIIIVESEQIAHQSNNGSTGLALLLRGQGGTTAAAHGCVTVSRCDLVMVYSFTHLFMSADGDTPAFSSRYHRIPVLYALHLALKSNGQDDEAKDAYDLYVGMKTQARREIRRQTRDIANRRVRAAYD